MKLFDDLLESSAKMADKVAKVTGEYIDKGKDKINELSLENELGKAHKQLGALVYALHKAGETNEELVNQYIEDIAKIEKQLEEARKEDVETAEPVTSEVVKFCSNCGTELSCDDAFCRNCGNSVK
ncbi:MAG: zinc ribbon domain-containing protein [Oscillospiraceae bacterium]|nr:zinc ribbon domain-containing protein [Oscillospiraceae bacterium]